jgi:hypothetical protein
VLVEDDPTTALGSALALARAQEVAVLHVLVEDEVAAGILARRAELFTVPPSIWLIRGRSVEPAVATPHPAEAPPPPVLAAFAERLAAAGADPVYEHGVLRGEVHGLEVARVVTGGAWGQEHDAPPHLEVGVGRYDREAFIAMHPGVDPASALERVVADVRRHRRLDAEPHPLNRLAPERWLRARIVADPARVGVARLGPVAPPTPQADLRQSLVAPAVGVDADGRDVVVVCSTGVDLDLVPAAADVRLRERPDARLLLVLPARDALPVTRALAESLARPAEVVTLEVTGHHSLPGEAEPDDGPDGAPDGGPGDGPSVA